jgi:hypothetical protein
VIAADAIVGVRAIEIGIEPYDWRFATEQADRIDAHWDRLRIDKPRLFDGRVLIAHRLDIAHGVLRGACFEASYKAFIAWRDFGFPDALVRNLFAMPALRAANGAFMLGEMSATTANAGRLYFPAGTPEPSDADATGRVDYEANILRELEEETGLAPDEVTLDPGWTIVSLGALVACMKVVRSDRTAAELQARLVAFNETQAHPELTRLVPVFGAADYDATRMPPFMLRYLSDVLATP